MHEVYYTLVGCNLLTSLIGYDLFWICRTTCSYTVVPQLTIFQLTHRVAVAEIVVPSDNAFISQTTHALLCSDEVNYFVFVTEKHNNSVTFRTYNNKKYFANLPPITGYFDIQEYVDNVLFSTKFYLVRCAR